MTPKLMLIEWFDSAYTNGTFSVNELKDYKLVHINTVGFGVELEDRYIVAKECQDEESYRYVSVIPKVNIISVKHLYTKRRKE